MAWCLTAGLIMVIRWSDDPTAGFLFAPFVAGGFVVAVVGEFVRMSRYSDMPTFHRQLRGSATGCLTCSLVSLAIFTFTVFPGSVRLYTVLLSGKR